MLKVSKHELICDLAETYHVLDYTELPVQTLATLACGLRADSRTMMRLTGRDLPSDLTLLASITDKLSILLWRQTKDGQKGINKPELILGKKQSDELEKFSSGAEFDKARERLLRRIKNG